MYTIIAATITATVTTTVVLVPDLVYIFPLAVEELDTPVFFQGFDHGSADRLRRRQG